MRFIEKRMLLSAPARLLLLAALLVAWRPAGALPTARAHAAPSLQPTPAPVDRLLARMTLSQKIGQLFMFSITGTAMSPNLQRMVRDWGIGGIILYRPNVTSRYQLEALLHRAQGAARIPLLVAADEEGGTIAMVPFSLGVHPLLSPSTYGRIDSTARVYDDALAAGRDLRALGVTLNLAPVLDVLTDPASPIGARSYGPDPQTVARLGSAAIRGYQDAGIAATAKHFLGLGGVGLDAHVSLPTTYRTLDQLEKTELVPMRAAIASGVDALMVTHVLIPALDPSGTPASLSRPIITGYIRGRLHYTGLIITDSLTMGAITDHRSIAAAAVQAVIAGNDIVLISDYRPIPAATLRGAIDAVARAVARGAIPLATINAAVRHVLVLKEQAGLLP